MDPKWQALVDKKRAQLRDAVRPEWRLPEGLVAKLQSQVTRPERLSELGIVEKSGILSEYELEITGRYTAGELLAKLASGEFRAVDVVTAFCKRAAIAEQLVSCLTEAFFEEAIERAKWLDTYFAEHGKPLGPFHGLPISIKEIFLVVGGQSTAGYITFLQDPPATKNSPLVQLLHDAGGIPFVMTNIPQSVMTFDTENNIFGRTLNPLNTSLSSGGSSGGEGALVALRGSPLGMGTDIGGSIRVPAAFTGTYGFKPTAGRVPMGGCLDWLAGLHGLPRLVPSAGPFANSLADLQLFMRLCLAQGRPWRYDITASTLPWRDAPPKLKLRIGLPPYAALFPPHPPVRRAVAAAARALEQAGHAVVRLPADPLRDLGLGVRIARGYLVLGQLFRKGRHLLRETGEPAVPSLAKALMAGADPALLGEHIVDPGLPLAEMGDALHRAREAYGEAWRRAFVGWDLDVLLMPVAQSVAPGFDEMILPPYTWSWNLLDFPACSIPYGTASKMLDPEPVKMKAPLAPQYYPEEMDGMPCAIQLVAPRYLDEELLQAAEVVDKVLRSTQKVRYRL